MEINLLNIIRSRLKDREDSEHESLIVKFIMGIVWLITLLILSDHPEVMPESIAFSVLYILVSPILFIWVLLVPKVNPLRRLIGISLDAAIITCIMLFSGEAGTPLFAGYLFMTFGHGFRYGNKYLFISAFMCIVGFYTLTIYSDYWNQQKILSNGIIFATIVLSLYVSMLISKLHSAVNEAKEANEAKSQFLANMSHEIRTPLNGVIGMSALLSSTSLTTKQKDYSSTISASAKTLLALINDILDISKIEAGKVTTETINFDLYVIINSLKKMLSPQAENKGLAFHTYISPSVPFLLQGDEQHLRQILINLISNAIKFTDNGFIYVIVTNLASAHGKVRLKFEIRDTGVGIPEEAREKLFDKFTQADESTTRKFGGTGLGMAIAKQLVETMGGEIFFDSEVNKGSSFWFELDFNEQSVLSEEKASGLDFNNISILLVNPVKKYSEFIENHLSTWNINYKRIDDAQIATDEIFNANKNFTHIVVFKKYLDINSIEFIRSVKERIKSLNFILVDDEPFSETDLNKLINAGYNSIIHSNPERNTIFRTIHASSFDLSENIFELSLNETSKNNVREQHFPKALNILVGEDNETNQKVIKNILEYHAHIITIADNGEEVLDILEKKDFDLIILDMHMPIMGGIEAAKIFRFMSPNKKHIPILMLTANATREAIEACKEAKLDAYLIKPVEPEKLLNTVSLLTGEKNIPVSNNEASLKIIDINNPDNQPIIDSNTLEVLNTMSNENSFMRKLVDGYVRDAEKTITGLNDSIKQRDYETIAGLAHSLDGSSRSIGAKRLAKSADTLYKIINSTDRNKVEDNLQELEILFQDTKSALYSFIEKKSSLSINPSTKK